MNKEKNYTIRVKVEWDMSILATDKEHAKQMVLDIFEQEHNIDLSDKEIIEIVEDIEKNKGE
jgi:hypothetical protein